MYLSPACLEDPAQLIRITQGGYTASGDEFHFVSSDAVSVYTRQP